MEVKLTKALKAKWMDYLRSGRIQQGKHFLLRESGAMCCLGVLAVLDPSVLPDQSSVMMNANSYPIRTSVLTIDEQTHLTAMNDGAGNERAPSSFSEIAQWIEDNIVAEDEDAKIVF